MSSVHSSSQPKNMLSPDPSQIERPVWFCNYSGTLIPELQEKYGREPEITSEDLFEEWDEEDEDEEDVGHYILYPCGHLLLDEIFLQSLDYSPSKKEEWSQKIKEECPFCAFSMKREEVIFPNSTFTPLDLVYHLLYPGALQIPGKLARYFYTRFQKGDIIDTAGYRAIGLHIYDGSRFQMVPSESSEPSWPLEYLLLRGYRYYHSFHPCFESMPFQGDVELMMHGFFISSVDESSFEREDERTSKFTNKLREAPKIEEISPETFLSLVEITADRGASYLNECIFDYENNYYLQIRPGERLYSIQGTLYFGSDDGKDLLLVYP